jgi:hypothetical protein
MAPCRGDDVVGRAASGLVDEEEALWSAHNLARTCSIASAMEPSTVNPAAL